MGARVGVQRGAGKVAAKGKEAGVETGGEMVAIPGAVAAADAETERTKADVTVGTRGGV